MNKLQRKCKSDEINGDVVVVNVKRVFFDQIKENTKVVEGRLGTQKFKNVRLGDNLKFVCGADCAYRRVIQISMHDNFKELLTHEGLNNFLPGVNTIEDGVKTYASFYDAEATGKLKALAFRWSCNDFGSIPEKPKRRYGEKVQKKSTKGNTSVQVSVSLRSSCDEK